ncbi:NAD(P)-dependent oxidoreductase [Bosea sp. RCC_152_1]|uniref:NAD(P)-dependent oxidoreductase n=1 Tax=Bosea sp. RCC_152_1 TaxID=3239228 RepID=UPI003526B7ED
MSEKIAFIGLGAMGGPMATNIVRKGIPLTVYDIAEANLERVAAAGGHRTASVAEAAKGAHIVITMLPATQHVLDVVAGKDGVLENITPGGVVMDMSTISPTGTDAVAAACSARGIRFLDAPVGRLASHAAAGKSLFMVGCDDEALFAEVKPLLDAMGDTIIRCGGTGTGIRIKIVNNFQVMSIAQITAEALVLAAKLGLDIETVKAINAGTTATNGQMQVNFATKSLVGDTQPGFTIDLAHKDVSLAMEAAHANRLGLPVGAAVHAAYGAARSGDYARKDFTAMLDYAAELAGIAPPRLR